MKIGKKIGQIFKVPLDESSWTYGIVIFESAKIRNGIIIGIFDALSKDGDDKLEGINRGNSNLLGVPNYTSVKIIDEGDWPLASTNPALAQAIELPILGVAHSLFRGDDEIGKVEARHVSKYTTQQGQGKLVVEARARNLLGLNPKLNVTSR